MGSKNQGQGHETTFKQVLNEKLGLDPGERPIHRRRHRPGRLRHRHQRLALDGDRRLGACGWRPTRSSPRARSIAAHLLEAAEADIEFRRWAQFLGRRHRPAAVASTDVAKASFQAGRLPPGLEGGLLRDRHLRPRRQHLSQWLPCLRGRDRPRHRRSSTSSRYVVVDDVGTVVNPIGLKGQIHGGVAQGLGQALMEQVVYDRESGQILTGSFMDYAMPRADDLPYLEVTSNPVPTKLNPLGAKGAGEAGTVGALPAIVNAVLDALAPLGVKRLDMPATSSASGTRSAGARLAKRRHSGATQVRAPEPQNTDLSGPAHCGRSLT